MPDCSSKKFFDHACQEEISRNPMICPKPKDRICGHCDFFNLNSYKATKTSVLRELQDKYNTLTGSGRWIWRLTPQARDFIKNYLTKYFRGL